MPALRPVQSYVRRRPELDLPTFGVGPLHQVLSDTSQAGQPMTSGSSAKDWSRIVPLLIRLFSARDHASISFQWMRRGPGHRCPRSRRVSAPDRRALTLFRRCKNKIGRERVPNGGIARCETRWHGASKGV